MSTDGLSVGLFRANNFRHLNFRVPIHVPTGYAVFPNEIMCVPKFVLANTYKNLTTVTYQKDGGHFAAFEQPEMLEKDVRLFVRETEKLFPEELRPPTGFAGTLK